MMKTPSWSDELDQKKPAYQIASSKNPRIRVLAGPGTGKSFAMKRRVARLLEEGILPKKILPVTFTRVAAGDLQRELSNVTAPNSDKLKAFTLHSLALRILTNNDVFAATGRVIRPLNKFELEPLVCDLMEAHGGKKKVRELTKAYEAAWARLQHDQPGYAPTPEEVKFQTDLVNWLVFHEAMLIGEVIPQLYKYLDSNPAAPEKTKYDYVLVDEYQDLNRAEQEVIKLLSDDGGAEVCVVGDDDQSIYSFKYAHPEGIREWIGIYPKADDIKIGDCRRCPTNIVAIANNLIENNSQRSSQKRLKPISKNGEGVIDIISYRTKDEEIAGIVKLVSQMIKKDKTLPGDILILIQDKYFGTEIHEALMEKEIPTKSYYAESELEDEDAQRAFALLKLLVNHEDRIALRCLFRTSRENWSTPTYSHIRGYCESNNISPWKMMSQLNNGAILPLHHKSGRRVSTRRIIEKFREILQKLNELAPLSLKKKVDNLFPEKQASTQGMRTLAIDILENKNIDDVKEFTDELSIAITNPEPPTKIKEVRVMSLHKSKGLSAPVTVIANCVQGFLPRDIDIEEQRRLFYVGITRVKAIPKEDKPGRLILTYSRQMPISDVLRVGIEPTQVHNNQSSVFPSQFIEELGIAG